MLDIDGPIAKEIENHYVKILHRYPRRRDLKSHISLLESGKIHLSDLKSAMESSEEFKLVTNLKKTQEGPIETVDGVKMYLDPTDYTVSGYLSLHKMWEPLETSIIKDFFSIDTNFIDIGSHIGYYSLLCASISIKGTVLSFEPEQQNFKLLQKNIKLNNFKNITPIQKAVSNSNKITKLYLTNEGNTGDHRFFETDLLEINEKRKSVKVSCMKLDDYLSNKKITPSVIKMDIQGSEMLALEGMTKTLQDTSSLAFLTEFWPKGIMSTGKSPLEFLESIESFGFEIYEMIESQKKLQKKSKQQLIDENLQEDNPDAQTDLLCLKNLNYEKVKNLK